MIAEAIIEVRFYTSSEGGRKTPVTGSYFGCPLLVDGEYFDCRLILNGDTLEPGKTYSVPVAFLFPDLAIPKLRLGKSIELWEGKPIGSGSVVQIGASSM